ncbi:MAG TPA: alpha/beta fold hydrolase [Caulobacteraceae bacterium]|jgi:pimeloyl-ACP methyl ester carboxylesterase
MQCNLTGFLVVALALGLHSHAAARDVGPHSGAPFEQHHLVDGLGRTVTYYISRPTTTAPLLLMIQGSGCTEVFNRTGAQTYSTVYDALPIAASHRFTVVVVEKPFAGQAAGAERGTATGCSSEFNQDFTAQRWLEALRAALADARKSPSVDPSRTLVLGHSEGAVMAAMLAGRDPMITDVVSFAGSGTSQLFDLLALAYQTCTDQSACIQDIERQARAIAAKPDSATDFAWGHPFKRWASFFKVNPAEELLRSHARVYLAAGTDDRNVPILSMEIAAATLLGAGRDVTVRRIPGADHSLGGGGDSTEAEYQRALDWFWSK